MNENINNLFDKFIDECRYVRQRSDSSIIGYKASFHLLQAIFPDICCNTIDKDMLVEFFRQLESRPRLIGSKQEVRRGVKATTIATHRSKLNTFFTWLKDNGHIKKNPFDNIPYPDVNYDDKKFLRKEELEKIIAAIFTDYDSDPFLRKRNIAIIYVLLYCGLRRNELINLKCREINLEKEEITIEGETSKSRRTRIIPMHSQVKAVLIDYLNERKKLSYTTPYLFVSKNRDEKLKLSGFKHFIDNLKKKSGVKFSAHPFRHTFAVNALANGSDIIKLKQLLGHRDIRMTATYLRCLPTEIMRQDVQSLNINNFV